MGLQGSNFLTLGRRGTVIQHLICSINVLQVCCAISSPEACHSPRCVVATEHPHAAVVTETGANDRVPMLLGPALQSAVALVYGTSEETF